ncbi:MAG TPA: DUF2520 domain-containing protein [Flavipsychrobacter sp.]|nr:DUF2520 domain-containing protein [Flavipsychrobacter sp.]
MTYTLIGTGNMAWFLSKRLYEKGAKCTGVYGRNTEAATQLADSVHTNIVASLHQIPETDFCIIAVTDRSISEISTQLHLKETVVVHTAGSIPLDVLVQTHKAVIWPVYSINKNNLPTHRNIPMVYEHSSEKAKQTVTQLAYTVSDMVQEVNWQQRQWLHLCAVIGNNFTNHLMTLCEKIAQSQNLPFSLIRPILQQTFETVTTIEPSLLQTGPAIRNDKETMQKHLHLLQQQTVLQELYRSLSASIEDLYKTTNETKHPNC